MTSGGKIRLGKKKLRRNSRYVARYLNNKLIIMDPKAEYFYTLSGSAIHIWKMLRRTMTFSQIIDDIQNRFDLPEKDIPSISRFLETALKNNLILSV